MTTNQINCCLNCNENLSCNFDNNSCKDYKNITNENCKNILTKYCLGNDLNENDESWLLRWPDNNKEGCWKFFSCNLNGNCDKLKNKENNNFCQNFRNIPYNLGNLNWSKNFLLQVIQKYNNQNYKLAQSPDSKYYNSFQNKLFDNICCDEPAVCQEIVKNVCKYNTLDQLNRNPLLTKWCGCSLPDNLYKKYSNIGIKKECTPYCHNKTTIPKTNTNGNPIICDQDVCLIDNNTIKLINSQSQDLNLNFTNICGNCSDENSSCQCFIYNNDITILDSTLKNAGINLREKCGNFVCEIDNNTGVGPSKLPVPCNLNDDINQDINNIKKQVNNKKVTKNFLAFILIIIGIIIFLILLISIKLNTKIYYYLIILILIILYFIFSLYLSYFYF